MKYLKWLFLCLALASCSLPPPVVDPVPPPGPTPVVKVHSLYLVLIDNATGNTQDQAAFLGDLGYWNTLKARGHQWQRFDVEQINNAVAKTTKTDADRVLASYKQAVADANGLPCVVFIDPLTKTTLASVILPSDKAGMDAEILKWSDK
jgi:hypothetical protein